MPCQFIPAYGKDDMQGIHPMHSLSNRALSASPLIMYIVKGGDS